jgi:hypothetical protein
MYILPRVYKIKSMPHYARFFQQISEASPVEQKSRDFWSLLAVIYIRARARVCVCVCVCGCNIRVCNGGFACHLSESECLVQKGRALESLGVRYKVISTRSEWEETAAKIRHVLTTRSFGMDRVHALFSVYVCLCM